MYKFILKITIAVILATVLVITFSCVSFKPGIEQPATLSGYQVGMMNAAMMEFKTECGAFRLTYRWVGKKCPMPMIIGDKYKIIFDTTKYKTDVDGNKHYNYKIEKI